MPRRSKVARTGYYESLLQKKGAQASIIGIPITIILSLIGYWISIHYASSPSDTNTHGQQPTQQQPSATPTSATQEDNGDGARQKGNGDLVLPADLAQSLRASKPRTYAVEWVYVAGSTFRRRRDRYTCENAKGVYVVQTNLEGNYEIDDNRTRISVPGESPSGNMMKLVMTEAYEKIMADATTRLRRYLKAKSCDVLMDTSERIQLTCGGMIAKDVFVMEIPWVSSHGLLTAFSAILGRKTIMDLGRVPYDSSATYAGTNELWSLFKNVQEQQRLKRTNHRSN